MSFMTDLIIDAIFAAISSVGFGMVFNIPKRTLAHAACGGAVVLTTRNLLLLANFNIVIAAFFSSLLIGIISLFWSRKYKVPRSVYTVPSIIPIIPGTFAIRAMTTLIEMNANGITSQAINIFGENTLKTISILGAISFGIAIPSLYFMRLREIDANKN